MTRDRRGYRKVLTYQLPALLWAAAIFVFSSIPSSSIPEFALFRQDKLLHLGVFFILALLLHRALTFQEQSPFLRRHSEAMALLGTVLYGGFDEFHQLFVAGRSADPGDIIADTVGGLLFLIVLWSLRRFRARAKSPRAVR